MSNAKRAGRWPPSADYVLCDSSANAFACGLLQLGKIDRRASPAEQPSGAYQTTRGHLRSAATEALEIISGRDCAALDIGCNDGTLLSYYPRWVDRYGVDPSETIEVVGDWSWTARAAFPSAELGRAFGGKRFDIITAISVLEKVDDPRTFFSGVKSLLSEDGVFVLETLYAPVALAQTHVGAFTSGAKAIYSLGVLERLARDYGFKIFRGALTDKEGGSIRLYLTHSAVEEYDFDPWYERLARLWDEENALALRSVQSYQAFESRAARARDEYKSLLRELQEKGESAHLLSVGPSALSLYRWGGKESRIISAAVSIQPPEPGATLFERGPALISETDSRAAEPDCLIAPVALKRELLERWRESIMLGARMIFATPEPTVVTSANFAAEFGKSIAGGDAGGEVETLRTILTAAGGPRLIAEGRKDAKQSSG